MPSSELVPTPLGPARVLVDDIPAPGGASCTLVLGHGAGGGVDARDLAALAAALPSYGVRVARVEQPWRVAGRRIAPTAGRLDEAWRAVLDGLQIDGGLVVGGRSAGARVACRTAGELGARACLALAFPLHPPGRPERSRLEELLGARVPTLVVQGERDVFGGPGQFPRQVPVVAMPGADHSFAVPARAEPGQQALLGLVVASVANWLASLQLVLAGPDGAR